MVCPTGSYDANVEPAKDDVLFTDPEKFLEVVEAFFKSVYGQLDSCFDNDGNYDSLVRPRDCLRIGVDRQTYSKDPQSLPRAIVNIEETTTTPGPGGYLRGGNRQADSHRTLSSTMDPERNYQRAGS